MDSKILSKRLSKYVFEVQVPTSSISKYQAYGIKESQTWYLLSKTINWSMCIFGTKDASLV